MTTSTVNVGGFTITMLMICLNEVKNKNRKHAYEVQAKTVIVSPENIPIAENISGKNIW